MNIAPRFNHDPATAPYRAGQSEDVTWLGEEIEVRIGRVDLLVDIEITAYVTAHETVSCRDQMRWRAAGYGDWNWAECSAWRGSYHRPDTDEDWMARLVSKAVEKRWQSISDHVWSEVRANA